MCGEYRFASIGAARMAITLATGTYKYCQKH